MKTRVHRSEVRHQLGRLARSGGPQVSVRALEAGLGYPLAEASPEELRGVCAALAAVVDANIATVLTARPL